MKKKKSLMLLHLLLLASLSYMGCSSDEESELSVHYCIKDQSGKELPSFYEGQEIFFELTVSNTSDHEFKFKDEREFILSAFSVYNSDGDYIDAAAKSMLDMMRPVSIKPGESFYKRQRWERNPLPPGDYYSPLSIRIGKKTRSYITKFKVQ